MGGRSTRPGPSGDFQDLRKRAARRAGAALRFHLRVGRPGAAYPASAGRSEDAGVRSPAGVDRDRLACCTLVWTGPAAGVKWQVAAASTKSGSPAIPAPGSLLLDRLFSLHLSQP